MYSRISPLADGSSLMLAGALAAVAAAAPASPGSLTAPPPTALPCFTSEPGAGKDLCVLGLDYTYYVQGFGIIAERASRAGAGALPCGAAGGGRGEGGKVEGRQRGRASGWLLWGPLQIGINSHRCHYSYRCRCVACRLRSSPSPTTCCPCHTSMVARGTCHNRGPSTPQVHACR